MLQYTQIDLLSMAEETSPKPILLARLMRILHGVFQSKPETFAIALPSHDPPCRWLRRICHRYMQH